MYTPSKGVYYVQLTTREGVVINLPAAGYDEAWNIISALNDNGPYRDRWEE